MQQLMRGESAMNILVCMKQTFDTEAKIILDNGVISEEDVTFIVNPYDEYAIEEAIRWRDEVGGTVTVITVGKERVRDAVMSALAMGADEAIIVEEPEQGCDSFMVSQILYAVIKDKPYDLVLAGNQSVDDGSSQVAIRLAELLAIGHIGSVVQLSVHDRHVTAQQDLQGIMQIVEGDLPLLITAQQGLNEPRYPSLLGIRKAAKKPITMLTIDDLFLDPEKMTKRSLLVEVSLPKAKTQATILQGEVSEQVAALLHGLHDISKIL